MHLPATAWRERTARSCSARSQLRGARSEADVRADFARLRAGYDARWEKGF